MCATTWYTLVVSLSIQIPKFKSDTSLVSLDKNLFCVTIFFSSLVNFAQFQDYGQFCVFPSSSCFDLDLGSQNLNIPLQSLFSVDYVNAKYEKSDMRAGCEQIFGGKVTYIGAQ